MCVPRHFALSQGVDQLASCLAQRKPVPGVNRAGPLEIGQLKRVDAVPAVGRAEQREQRLVLAYGEGLAIAESPTLRSESEGDDFDFGKERRAHFCGVSVG